MTNPDSPPDLDAIWQVTSPEALKALLEPDDGTEAAPAAEYLNWEDFRQQFTVLPETDEDEAIDETAAAQNWLLLKLGRRQLYRPLPFFDVFGRSFQYAVPVSAIELLHQIERDTASAPKSFEALTSTQTKTTYLRKSLVEEAIRSSQLEGTITTRRAAKDLILAGKEPAEAGPRRIFNNYLALQQVREWNTEALTPARIIELQALVTRGTLEDESAVGRLRNVDEHTEVLDENGEVLHEPPDAGELEDRLQALCDFANGVGSDEFVHPVLRAMLVHFAFIYDHPFVDGNGRTARAVFYWVMARGGYRLAEYASISRVLRKSRAQYTRALADTISDDNDVTYFLLYQLNILSKAILELHEYLERKSAEMKDVAARIEHDDSFESSLNKRQLDLIANALKEPNALYTIESHKRTHGTAYATSRADLLQLAELGLLDHQKRGRSFVFVPVPELRSKLPKAAAQ